MNTKPISKKRRINIPKLDKFASIFEYAKTENKKAKGSSFYSPQNRRRYVFQYSTTVLNNE